MTIRLLADKYGYKAGNIVTLDGPTEAGLVAAGEALRDLTGGTAPPFVQSQVAISSKMAILGDSYWANGFSGNFLVGNSGPLAMNEYLGLPWDISYNGSISGTTSTDWLTNPAMLAGVLASDAAHAFVGFPNNDAANVANLQQSMDNMSRIFAQLAAAGKRIKVCTRGALNAVWTPAHFGYSKQISDWIVALARQNRWPVYNMEAALYDQATGIGNTSLLYADNLHPNLAGFLFAAALSDPDFHAETPRAVARFNSPANLIYNGGLNGAVSNPNTPGTMTIPGWTNYNTGGTQTLASSKVARTDTLGADFLRLQLTSGAIADRQGLTQIINFSTAVARSTAYALGVTRLDPAGNLQRCIVAGNSAAGAPAFATVLGATTVDGTVTWERATNIIPGVSRVTIRGDYDISTVSGGDQGCQLNILGNFTGGGSPNIRAHGTGVSAVDPAQRHIMTKRRRPGLSTPYQFLVPFGATQLQVYAYFGFSAAAVTATCDMYDLDMQVE